MKRKIIKINEDLCNGCGKCIDSCYEGALQLIDGKARIVSELYCDGLGACIGDCPLGAISIEERESEEYNEIAVLEKILIKGKDTLQAHLKHLDHHGEKLYLQQAMEYLTLKGIEIDISGNSKNETNNCACQGSMERDLKQNIELQSIVNKEELSQLGNWPIQFHLLNSNASFLRNSDILIAADCTAYSYANFHNRFMKHRALIIACPKLDHDTDIYIQKLKEIINNANINTLTVVIMEVPCCNGLIHLVKTALNQANQTVPLKQIVISIDGKILSENWI